MRILLCAKSHYSKYNTGDSDIILGLYSFLKEHNVEVDITRADEEADYKSYDIIHLFDINNIFDTYKHFKAASSSGAAIVISPMYFNMNRFYEYSGNADRRNSWNNCRAYREMIIKRSSLIFCNSEYEKHNIEKDFGIKDKFVVIYNGIRFKDEDVPLYNFKERYNLDNYILCAGRICDSKNQLMLSRICDEIKVPLVLIGTTSDESYLKACLKYNNTMYLGFLNEYDLYNAYSFARAHVLASFFEVTSISSLKAAAYGCNVVVTEEGASREYFKDMAHYCNPYSYDDVKKAVINSINQRKSDRLKNYVRENYIFTSSLEQIYEKYLEITK